MDAPKFHWLDYIVLVLFLLSSCFIGVLIAYLNRHRKTTTQFLMGGKEMHFLPVGLSILATFLSANVILGLPGEIYAFGTTYAYCSLSFFIAIPFCAHFVLPIFHSEKLISGYQYLELRFDWTVKTAASMTFLLMMLLYLPVALYSPSLALAQVSGFSVEFASICCGAVCIFYTVLGGLKATIINDAIQIVIFFIVFLLLICLVTADVGGATETWNLAVKGGRLAIPSFSPDPREYYTFWTQVIGQSSMNIYMYGASQAIIQKFLSVSTLKDAKKAVYICMFGYFSIVVLVGVFGCVMYAYFYDCDPITEGHVSRIDQMVSYLVVEALGEFHGLPGFLLATSFSATLGTISGCINAMVAVLLVDFVRPVYIRLAGKDLSEKPAHTLSRIFVLLLGIITIAFSLEVGNLGETLTALTIVIFGFVGGPLAAVVTLGILCPWINGKGALSGLVASLLFSTWLAVGGITHSAPRQMLPMDTSGCLANSSIHGNYTLFYENENNFVLYDVSVMWYGWIAIIVCTIVAVIVSGMFGWAKPGRDYDARLVWWYTTNEIKNEECEQTDVQPGSTVVHSNAAFTREDLDGTEDICLHL